MTPTKQKILNIFGREPETLDQLAECTIAVINSHIGTKVVGFQWDINYSKEVSNSHSSPEGYPQNWEGKPSLPEYYGGWSGRVWIRYEKPLPSFVSDPFRATLTHTGTGGAGSYNGPWSKISSFHYGYYGHKRLTAGDYPRPDCYSWDFKIFELDWPLLARAVEKAHVWSALSDTPWDRNHKYSWTDPKTYADDRKFMFGVKVKQRLEHG
jgi:hypothetical protein